LISSVTGSVKDILPGLTTSFKDMGLSEALVADNFSDLVQLAHVQLNTFAS
jgi:hypothetical protein